MTRTNGRAVTIRGTTYPSLSAAARAHGVNYNTVYVARRKGTLHRVGLGRVGAEPLPVCIGGQTYATAKAASKALGIKIGTIYAAIADGEPDRVLKRQTYAVPWSQPITIGNRTYPSKAAANRALGFKSRDYVNKVIASGSKKGWERILAAAMALEARGVPPDHPRAG